MSHLALILSQIIVAFCKDGQDVEEFIDRNRDILGGPPKLDKRELWGLLKGIGARVR